VAFGTVITWTLGDPMHIEILVEDQSGKAFLDIAVERMISDGHTFQVHAYKGIGRIPRNLNRSGDASKRILLDQLPRLLRGYGAAFANIRAITRRLSSLSVISIIRNRAHFAQN
jgi:hypothetical protein